VFLSREDLSDQRVPVQLQDLQVERLLVGLPVRRRELDLLQRLRRVRVRLLRLLRLPLPDVQRLLRLLEQVRLQERLPVLGLLLAGGGRGRDGEACCKSVTKGSRSGGSAGASWPASPSPRQDSGSPLAPGLLESSRVRT
jgi:hypothetical protein